ncbi:hypothetical protein FB45DRAFT_712629, partial [Roridomyces roridus]
ELYQEMGIQSQTQRHAHVKQHKDVAIMLSHLTSNTVFDFSQDAAIETKVKDLYRAGLSKLAGPNGGHAKHLARHRLSLRNR